MYYLDVLPGYIWNLLVIMQIIVPFYVGFKKLSAMTFFVRCLPFALVCALFNYELGEWLIAVVIIYQVAINRIKGTALISIETSVILGISIITYPLGNLISLVVQQLFKQIGMTSDWFFVLGLTLCFILMTVCLWRLSPFLTSAFNNFPLDKQMLKAIILVLIIVFFLEEIIQEVAAQLAIVRIIQWLLIAAFCIFILIAFVIMKLVIAAYQIKAKSQREQEQMEIQEVRYQEIQEDYNALRKLRHDYQNILLSLKGALENSDVATALLNVEDALENTDSKIKFDKHVFGDMDKLKVAAIRGIVFSKLKLIVAKNIDVTFEVATEINALPGSMIDLSRIIGILIDNAIEATVNQEQPKIQIAFLSYENSYFEFIIRNTISQQTINLPKLFETGFTTKENHSGLGLAVVHELVDQTNSLDLETELQDGYLQFSLILKGSAAAHA